MNDTTPIGTPLPPPLPSGISGEPQQVPPPLPKQQADIIDMPKTVNSDPQQQTVNIDMPKTVNSDPQTTIEPALDTHAQIREAKKAEMKKRLEDQRAKREAKRARREERKAAEKAAELDLALSEAAADEAKAEEGEKKDDSTSTSKNSKKKGINTGKPAPTWIKESLFFFFCCCFPPTAIVGVVIGARIAKLNRQKKYKDAWALSKTGNVWLHITFFLGVIMQIVLMSYYMFNDV